MNDKFIITGLLLFFLGPLGIHRFYLGSIGLGIIHFLTLGGFGFLYLLDIILLVTGNMKDSEGNKVKPTLKE